MSKCQICRANESRVDITLDLAQGNYTILLCTECAENYRLDAQALEKDSLEPFLRRGLAIGKTTTETDTESAIRSCPNCGITADEVSEHGKVGCPFCYFVFSHLPQVQQRTTAGNSFLPDCSPDLEDTYQESVEILQRKLDEAIANEHFEVAAVLRDQINSQL